MKLKINYLYTYIVVDYVPLTQQSVVTGDTVSIYWSTFYCKYLHFTIAISIETHMG